MSIKLAVVGTGSFAQCFIPLLAAHPLVTEIILADLDAAKLMAAAERFGVARTLPSLDAVCGSDVDAVAIITQHWMHAGQARQALLAGKDVYSAVPAAVTVQDMMSLVETVERTGRIYMMGETSYYYPGTIYCRNRLTTGDFGHVVYAEGEYYHDWDNGLYEVLAQRRGPGSRDDWGDPPMHYPTHSVGAVLGATGSRAVAVSCFGFTDTRLEDRDIYNAANPNGNVFSNETALMQMADGSAMRINEFRRIGHPGAERMSLFGTEASFEQNTISAAWLTKSGATDITAQLACSNPAFGGVSAVHEVDRLPAEFESLPNGHNGSHQFLVDDFVRACVTRIQPPVDVWTAAGYVLPGLIAHESAMQGGKLLPVPVVHGPEGATR